MPAQLGDIEMAANQKKRRTSPMLEGLQPTTAREGNRWMRSGIGAGMQGGEIAMQVSPNGTPELTNDATAMAGARPMPANGRGSPLLTPGVSNIADDVPLDQRGSINNVGNGIGGASFGQAGDAALAYGRFERANQEREKMIQASRRGSIGEGGGRVTVVKDSARVPTRDDRLRARNDEQVARTEALRTQTQQGIMAGADQLMTSQLGRQKTQQDITAGQYGLEDRQRLADLGAQLANPDLGQRADAEREYLLRVDPKAYLDRQAKAGVDQVDLETKQINRDLLRAELHQASTGGNLKLTEQQSKDLGYYARGNEANAQLATQGDALTGRESGDRGRLRGLLDTTIRGTPYLGETAFANSLVSSERQQAEQSGREVLSAILRKDTGAAITNQEMEIYGKMYLPQAGDSAQVLNQKAEARTRALSSIRGGLGTAERNAAPLNDGQRSAGGAVQIRSDQDYAALPSGTTYVAPDGTTRRKP